MLKQRSGLGLLGDGRLKIVLTFRSHMSASEEKRSSMNILHHTKIRTPPGESDGIKYESKRIKNVYNGMI